MINFGPKAKSGKKPKKKASKTSSRAPRRPVGDSRDALMPEDVAEINRFSAAIDKMNMVADARRNVEAGAKAKS